MRRKGEERKAISQVFRNVLDIHCKLKNSLKLLRCSFFITLITGGYTLLTSFS